MNRKIINFVTKAIATGFGAGRCPLMPGTIGSIEGIAIFYLLLKLGQPYIVWISAIILFVIGMIVSSCAETLFAEKDSKRIVIDEISGCILFLLFVPFTKLCIILGLLIYRVLDIIKPYPINRLERLPKGWGIMLDDMAAGAFTAVILNVALLLKGCLI